MAVRSSQRRQSLAIELAAFLRERRPLAALDDGGVTVTDEAFQLSPRHDDDDGGFESIGDDDVLDEDNVSFAIYHRASLQLVVESPLAGFCDGLAKREDMTGLEITVTTSDPKYDFLCGRYSGRKRSTGTILINAANPDATLRQIGDSWVLHWDGKTVVSVQSRSRSKDFLPTGKISSYTLPGYPTFDFTVGDSSQPAAASRGSTVSPTRSAKKASTPAPGAAEASPDTFSPFSPQMSINELSSSANANTNTNANRHLSFSGRELGVTVGSRVSSKSVFRLRLVESLPNSNILVPEKYLQLYDRTALRELRAERYVRDDYDQFEMNELSERAYSEAIMTIRILLDDALRERDRAKQDLLVRNGEVRVLTDRLNNVVQLLDDKQRYRHSSEALFHDLTHVTQRNKSLEETLEQYRRKTQALEEQNRALLKVQRELQEEKDRTLSLSRAVLQLEREMQGKDLEIHRLESTLEVAKREYARQITPLSASGTHITVTTTSYPPPPPL